MTKTCNLCKRDLPLDCYYRAGDGGQAYGPCRQCRIAAGMERYRERKQRAAQNFERLTGMA
jgi:hypothetical protein